MSDSALGTIVAERHFEARNEAGEEHEVALRIGIPTHDPRPDGDWSCRYQITGVPNNRVGVAFGIDSLQAFLLALEKARAELAFSQRVNGLRLTWLEQDNWALPEFETKSGETRR
jgi:hypothetical protein